MIDKNWCINELHLRMRSYEEEIKLMIDNPDRYDADYIGDSRAMRELNTCKFVESIIENWPEDVDIRNEMVYGVLETLNKQYPISFLNGIDKNQDEWLKGEGEHNRAVNKRYNMLVLNDGRYTDWSRLRIYNLLDDNQISRRELNKMFGEDIGKEIYTHLMTFLDDTKPIIFPYYPQDNKWTMYCEIINEGDVKTIAICYIYRNGKPEKIMRFFDICETGAFDEIDQATYVNKRRKKYEEAMAKKEAATSHENDTL